MRRLLVTALILSSLSMTLSAEVFTVSSPDGRIVLTIDNGATLKYSVTYDGFQMIAPSPMGFEFVGEKAMKGDFYVLSTPVAELKKEEWNPVVRAKHAHVSIPYTSFVLNLKEKKGDARRMDVEFRVMNEGVAFRYTLFGGKRFDYRRIQKELTCFSVPSGSQAWMSNFARPYASSEEGEFFKTPVAQQGDSLVKGLPYLVEIDRKHYVAILEANMNE